MAVLGDLNLGSLSLPAYAMQSFCDSRSYLTARSPIESSRRAESISHLFIAQRHFSTLILWSGSSFIRRGKDIFAKRLYLVIWLRARAENGAAKSGTPSRADILTGVARRHGPGSVFPFPGRALRGAAGPARAVPGMARRHQQATQATKTWTTYPNWVGGVI